MPKRPTLKTSKEAAQYLRISLFTLDKMVREGSVNPYRTPGGHRRFSVGMLNRYLRASVKKQGT